MGIDAPLCDQSVTEHRYGKATAGGSPAAHTMQVRSFDMVTPVFPVR